MIRNIRTLTLGTPLVLDDNGIKYYCYFQKYFKNDGTMYIVAGEYLKYNEETKGSIIAPAKNFTVVNNTRLPDMDNKACGFRLIAFEPNFLGHKQIRQPAEEIDRTYIFLTDLIYEKNPYYILDQAKEKHYVHLIDETTVFGMEE